MSIPVIFAASLLLFLDGGFGQISPLVLGVGFVSSFIFGLAALTLLVYIVRRGNFYIFAIYLLPLGILVLSASLLGFL
jgi:undecaprenyl pyrophosphate phosphatase UppP